jgi:hypothetical protein
MNPISNDLALTPLDQATISQLRLCSPLGFNLRTPYADAGARSPGGTRSTRQASSSNRLNGSTPVARAVRPAVSLDRRRSCSANADGTPGTPLTNDPGRLVSSNRMTLDYSTCTQRLGVGQDFYKQYGSEPVGSLHEDVEDTSLIVSKEHERPRRGGSYTYEADFLRSASRNHYIPNERRDSVGCRIARTIR